MKDFYYILGVDTDSSLAEVEEAYLKLSQKFRPDLNAGDEYFKNRFAEVREAFETLADPKKRNQYDLALSRQIALKEQRRKYHTKRFKRKGPGVGFVLSSLVVVLVLGAYFSQYLITSKPARLTKPIAAVQEVPVHKLKKHRRHPAKDKFTADSTASGFKIKTEPIAAAPVKSYTAAATPAKPAIRPASDSVKTIHKDYLYAAYIHTNITGIVNMRVQDTYNSAVIETIPANSKVYVLAKGNTYYRVRFNNYTGYVPKWSVEQGQATASVR